MDNVFAQIGPEDCVARVPADVIHSIHELHFPTATKAVLYMRVSGREQKRRRNLARRADCLRDRMEAAGWTVAAEYREVACGRQLADRPGLRQAIAHARRIGAPVVTDARNRFLRGEGYDGRASTDEPSPHQLRGLLRLSWGVTLGTWLRPDANPSTVRGYETRIGFRSPPGKLKERRERLLPRVRKLINRGEGLRATSRRLKIPVSTVRRWAGHT